VWVLDYFGAGNRMKSGYPVSFGKDTDLFTTEGIPAPIAASIARLIEENAALRRLAASLSAQLDFARDLSGKSQLPS
jgi:hypothetical protein